MKLIPVDKRKNAPEILYDLLLERDVSENISHRHKPTFEQHLDFVFSNPYEAWYLIEVGDGMEGSLRVVGAVYITKARELGIFIFKSSRMKGYAKEALRIIMHKHPGRFLANINPANEKSIRLFGKLGFGLIQHTYELR